MRLKPLLDYVVIVPLAREEMSKGGIVLPQNTKENCFRGEVMAVGPGRMVEGKLVKPPIRKGNKVIFIGSVATTTVIIDGSEHFIVPYGVIVGKLE